MIDNKRSGGIARRFTKKGAAMKRVRKTANQETLERLRNENRELQSELKALQLELDCKEKELADSKAAFGKLQEQYEKYMDRYAERVEALAEAEREYKKATADARNLMARYKAEVEAQIAQMRQINTILS